MSAAATRAREAGACAGCPAGRMCLATAVRAHAGPAQALSVRRKRLHAGEHLYRMDEPVAGQVHLIRVGHIKTYHLDAEGEQRVCGFAMPGDLVGLEALAGQRHPHGAVALAGSEVCQLPPGALEQALARSAALARLFQDRLCDELDRHRQAAVMLRIRDPGRRLARFLGDVSRACAARSDGGAAFRLPMTREDIGDFLGLTPETVSRLLSHFQRLRCIAVDGREVRILDPGLLETMAAGGATELRLRRKPPCPSTNVHNGVHHVL